MQSSKTISHSSAKTESIPSSVCSLARQYLTVQQRQKVYHLQYAVFQDNISQFSKDRKYTICSMQPCKTISHSSAKTVSIPSAVCSLARQYLTVQQRQKVYYLQYAALQDKISQFSKDRKYTICSMQPCKTISHSSAKTESILSAVCSLARQDLTVQQRQKVYYLQYAVFQDNISQFSKDSKYTICSMQPSKTIPHSSAKTVIIPSAVCSLPRQYLTVQQ
ncbi:hypothetical protein DPMN_130857 [Dreissena polymorpha]|uniref:Uncharacterized protein n=1 Tax=Dreissena polymorpha TaxID=45954 RepID=A0A9D4K215_DREPO|nr:hypothetical protein DPMN_130857 [Dreissena polymorpha]